MPSLHQQKCFITGAASGIGRATAIAAAAQGAELFLTDINATALATTVDHIRQQGGQVSAFRALDIADHAAVKDFADSIIREYGAPDIVMNIAGISIWGRVDKLEVKHWRQCVEVNLMGPIHVIESLVPAMMQSGRGGHLVNVSSAAGLFGLPWHAAYSASKFGLRGISEVLRYDLKRYGIKVHLVCPGGVDTGLVQTIQIAGIDKSDPDIQALTQRFQKHAVTPEKAAAAILKGMQAGDYFIYTSFDIRFGHWWQRKFAWPFDVVMQTMNNYLQRVAGRKLEERLGK
ncbi:MAG: SDR family oxidoreductase [Pedobacter sp.]|nr:SDR family oxidoreductase [Pedobacter sp.]